MSIVATVRGNLTKNPETKIVQVDGEEKRIVEMRVYSDEYRREGDDLVQDDDRCIGIDVTLWSERQGDAAQRLLKKGARVEVRGSLFPHRYRDKDTQEPRLALQMTADSVALLLNRVEAIQFTPSRNARAARDESDRYEHDDMPA